MLEALVKPELLFYTNFGYSYKKEKEMLNSLEDILRDLSQALFLLSVPVNIIYFALVKIDKKLEVKLGDKNE